MKNIKDYIPQDVYDDVPEHKKEEFCRGILLYLKREKPDLNSIWEQSETLSADNEALLQQEIRSFAEMIKQRKGLS